MFGSLFLCVGIGGFAPAKTVSAIQAQTRVVATQTESQVHRAHLRWAHAKELLGTHYQKSVVRTGEEVADLHTFDTFVTQRTRKALKKNWKPFFEPISRTIINESTRYGFDPVFVLAVIESESSFDPEAIGSSGEIGLMQVTPETGRWISERSGFRWNGKVSLQDPITNIRVGTAYLAYLREEFEFQSNLYISAYNMGSGNVRRAMEKNTWPKDYTSKVLRKYVRYYADLNQQLTAP